MITWTRETRKLSELKPNPHNPKEIYKANAERLAESRDTFGEIEPFLIGPENELYDGHQRLNAWGDKYGLDFEVTCWQSNRALTEKEWQKLVVYKHKTTTGIFNFEELANWGIEEDLIDWGFDEAELIGDWGEENQDDAEYSRNIDAPIYEPKNEKPEVSELFDNSKTLSLIEGINAQDNLSDKEREFLIIAARRHTIIRFDLVADYYAHSPIDIQDLMETSALVIIDFDKAIELGYVKLSEAVARQYGIDYA